MTVYDLNRDQLVELKQNYLTENMEEQGYGVSYDVLADADNIISDERIYEIYAGTEFSPDDFFCSAGQEEQEEDIRFFVADTNGKSVYYLHAVSSINYEWSDWAASTFSKRGAQDALAWARKNGYRNAKAIAIID